PHESHLPERSVERAAPFGKAAAEVRWPATAPRPLRLLCNPEPVEALSAFALLQAPDCAGPAEPIHDFLPPSSPAPRRPRTPVAAGSFGAGHDVMERHENAGRRHRPGTIEPFAAPALDEAAPLAAFRWRGRVHRVRRVEGPERIAPEWWRPATGHALG